MGNNNSHLETLWSKSLSNSSMSSKKQPVYLSDQEEKKTPDHDSHPFANFKNRTINLFHQGYYDSVKDQGHTPFPPNDHTNSHLSPRHSTLKHPDVDYLEDGLDKLSSLSPSHSSMWNPMNSFANLGQILKGNLSPSCSPHPIHDLEGAQNSKSAYVAEEQDSNTKSKHDVAGVLNSGLIVLRPSECKALRRTWGYIIKDSQNVGIAVFTLIFKRCPEIKNIFPTFAYKCSNDLLKDHVFRAHSKRFIFTIRSIIDNLQDLKSVTTLMEALGRLHQKFPGFKPEYWIVFKDCILAVWQDIMGDDYTSDVKAAWELVINLMIIKMKEGYETTN